MSYDHLFTLADTSRNPQIGSGLAIQLICPECRDPVPEIIEEFAEGDIVCGGCGLVLSDHVVDTRGSCMFANDEDEDLSRVGAPANIMEDVKGLQTFISHEDGNTGVSQELRRAATEAADVSFPRSFVNAFSDIENMCNACRLPKKSAESAKSLYQQIVERRLLQWKSLDVTLAACILLGSQLVGVGRTFHEISRMTDVPIKKLGECSRAIQQALNLKIAGASSDSVPNASKQGLVSRICNGLGLPFIVEQMTMEIIQEANKHGIAVGRSPITIAATALYFTSNLLGYGISTKEICAVATVQETTIKPVYRLHYYNNAEKLVKQEWIVSGKADLSRLPLR